MNSAIAAVSARTNSREPMLGNAVTGYSTPALETKLATAVASRPASGLRGL